jgi:hypothetical protein
MEVRQLHKRLRLPTPTQPTQPLYCTTRLAVSDCMLFFMVANRWAGRPALDMRSSLHRLTTWRPCMWTVQVGRQEVQPPLAIVGSWPSKPQHSTHDRTSTWSQPVALCRHNMALPCGCTFKFSEARIRAKDASCSLPSVAHGHYDNLQDSSYRAAAFFNKHVHHRGPTHPTPTNWLPNIQIARM